MLEYRDEMMVDDNFAAADAYEIYRNDYESYVEDMKEMERADDYRIRIFSILENMVELDPRIMDIMYMMRGYLPEDSMIGLTEEEIRERFNSEPYEVNYRKVGNILTVYNDEGRVNYHMYRNYCVKESYE